MLSPYLSIFFCPRTVSPTLPAQAGEGRHRFVAAASRNSALLRVVSCPGMARSQAEDTLSLCLQAQAALVDLGLTMFRAFTSILALVFSTASVIAFLVAPDTEPLPTPSTGRLSTSGTSSPSQAADWFASSCSLSQHRRRSTPTLEFEISTCLHLVSSGASSPQHSSPPQSPASWGQTFPLPAQHYI